MGKVLWSVMAAAVVAFGLVALSAQTKTSIVEMRVTLPDNGRSVLMRMSEHDARGGFEIDDVGEFGFKVAVYDHSTGVVRVTILEGYEPDARVLDEVEAVAGESSVQSTTSPSFAIAVLRIIRR